MAQFALRWILMFDAISCAIPGGKRPDQVADDCAPLDLPALSQAAMDAVNSIDNSRVRPLVHSRW
jgi:aryl-alcohol dehydrogenase-like predicted oxidoreductase